MENDLNKMLDDFATEHNTNPKTRPTKCINFYIVGVNKMLNLPYYITKDINNVPIVYEYGTQLLDKNDSLEDLFTNIHDTLSKIREVNYLATRFKGQDINKFDSYYNNYMVQQNDRYEIRVTLEFDISEILLYAITITEAKYLVDNKFLIRGASYSPKQNINLLESRKTFIGNMQNVVEELSAKEYKETKVELFSEPYYWFEDCQLPPCSGYPRKE
jgi:hypothetical protein